MAIEPIKNLNVKGSFKNIKDIMPPNKASKLNIIAACVDEVYFCAIFWIKKAIKVLNILKYNMGNMDSIETPFTPGSNIMTNIMDRITATNI